MPQRLKDPFSFWTAFEQDPDSHLDAYHILQESSVTTTATWFLTLYDTSSASIRKFNLSSEHWLMIRSSPSLYYSATACTSSRDSKSSWNGLHEWRIAYGTLTFGLDQWFSGPKVKAIGNCSPWTFGGLQLWEPVAYLLNCSRSRVKGSEVQAGLGWFFSHAWSFQLPKLWTCLSSATRGKNVSGAAKVRHWRMHTVLAHFCA